MAGWWYVVVCYEMLLLVTRVSQKCSELHIAVSRSMFSVHCSAPMRKFTSKIFPFLFRPYYKSDNINKYTSKIIRLNDCDASKNIFNCNLQT